MRFRQSLMRVRLEHDRAWIESERALPVAVGGSTPVYGTNVEFSRDGNGWKVIET